MIRAALLFLAAAACANDALSDGTPEVIDGDSLRVAGIAVRLSGIDAFERDQWCGIETTRWPCGQRATERMRALVANGVRCEPNGQTSYRRTVAVCFAGGQDVGGILVREGLALADPRYGANYRVLESTAAAFQSGVHSGPFQAPWEFRRR